MAVVDPVGAGFVQRLSRPGGNATGLGPGQFILGARDRQIMAAAPLLGVEITLMRVVEAATAHSRLTLRS
jgi:hypothetical protein